MGYFTEFLKNSHCWVELKSKKFVTVYRRNVCENSVYICSYLNPDYWAASMLALKWGVSEPACVSVNATGRGLTQSITLVILI